MKVVVETGLDSIEATIDGPLLLVPPGMYAKARTQDRVVLAPIEPPADRELPAPDVLVGYLPLIYLSPERTVKIHDLWLAAPAPFQESDIGTMLARVEKFPSLRLNPVVAQGRLGTGRSGRFGKVVAANEFLVIAHESCRALLSNWPQVETYEHLWRNLELRGGREDFALTERLMAGAAGRRLGGGKMLPQHTIRRRGSSDSWTSWAMHFAARRLGEEIRTKEAELANDELPRLSASLAAVAREARPGANESDSPFSAWPPNARQCYGALIAALSLVARGTGIAKAPLSHLWRLYEAWLSAVVYDAVVAEIGAPDAGAAEAAPGCDAFAQWSAEDSSVTFVVHPVIGRDGLNRSNALLPAVCSVSSDLAPDVLIELRGSRRLILVIDAKRRLTLTAMESGEVAEAGSKYVWGIRDPSATQDGVVDEVVIASSAPPGTMHSDLAKIRPIQTLPLATANLDQAVRDALTTANIRKRNQMNAGVRS